MITSPGRMGTPKVSFWPPFMTLPPLRVCWPGTAPDGLTAPVGTAQANGLKSCGAMMPPHWVVLA